uniref:Carbonic anhydrase n=1 Tax=Plectus sambesii TaxID=2011161 RepID=A0A914VX46_9BILA
MPYLLLLLLVSVMYMRVNGANEGNSEWGYDAANGPDVWTGLCAKGQRQSPVDIRTENLQLIHTSDLLFVNYNATGKVQVQNSGYSAAVTGFENWSERPSISGGGLSDVYDLVQFHLHWADKDNDGSEHQIGGLHYPLELHLVHLKRGLTFAAALEKADGLAVVGVLFAKADNDTVLKPLEPALVASRFLSGNASVADFQADSILPSSRNVFYRYEGSLTTPLCSEAVVWTVLAEPLFVSENQLNVFRQFVDLHGHPMLSNRRPVMPLNERKVYLRLSGAGTHLLPATYNVFVICLVALLGKEWIRE